MIAIGLAVGLAKPHLAKRPELRRLLGDGTEHAQAVQAVGSPGCGLARRCLYQRSHLVAKAEGYMQGSRVDSKATHGKRCSSP